MHVCVVACTYVYVRMFEFPLLLLGLSEYTCMYTCLYTYGHVCAFVYMYIYVCV